MSPSNQADIASISRVVRAVTRVRARVEHRARAIDADQGDASPP